MGKGKSRRVATGAPEAAVNASLHAPEKSQQPSTTGEVAMEQFAPLERVDVGRVLAENGNYKTAGTEEEDQ